MPRGKQNGLLPHVSAELKAHFLPSRGSLFMSATVTVEFPSVEGTLISGDDDPDNRHALLLTLSPLHEVGDVRVWVEKKKKVNGNTLGEWRSLQLDASTLYESRRRVVRDAGGMDFSSTRNAPPVAADSRCSLAEEEKTVVSAVEEEGEGARSEGDIDDEVLELVFETQDDDDEVDAYGGNKDEDLAEEGVNISLMSGREYNEDNDSNDMGNQIVVELWTCLASSSSSCTFTSAVPGVGGGECTTDESEWFISSCCIDIRLRSPTQLASLSYPPITVLSDARNIEFDQVTCDIDDDSYMLLIGQRIYDYFICPRVAYSGSGGDAVTFTVLDVYVTMISLFPEDAAPPWKVMPLCSLPVLSEDLICAFVRPEKKVDVRPVVEETHAGVSWRLQHHPSYTFMSSGTEPNMSIGMNLYFFHSDHASCDCLVPLMELAIKSWKETKSSMGSGSEVYVESDFSQKKITWVITGSSNTLLNLRRGALCTRGAVVLAVDVLRTIRKPMTSLSSLFHVDALRAKTAVLSSAFEVLWRMCKESGPVPEFHGTLVGVALTRAWAFCLLCNEFGWTELLCQERQIAFFGISALASVDVWWLTSRYVQEAYETLLLLSSAFVVASIRHHYMYPWQLLEKQDECKPPLETVSGSNITLSSGVHVSLVHHLLLLPFIQRGEARNLAAGAAASPPVLFLGSLYYEEIEKDSGCRDVTLRLNCLNVNPTHSPPPPRMSSLRAPNSIWGIDVPFSLVYFDVKGSHASKTYPENVGNEKGTDLCDAHVLPCCWRVSGLSWARGMDQHTSFTVLGMGKDHKYNPDTGGNKYMRFPEEDDEEKVQENATREAFSLRVPLLVLNPKIIPAAVLLRVNHAWFWSKLSSTPESLARRIILQHIMEQAAKEGEKNIEETYLVFTPLLNQLLEGLVEESCSQSFGEKRTSRVVLFLEALQKAELNSMTVRARIHPALYTRFMRLVSKRNLTAVTPLISAEKRQRDDDDVDGNEKGPVPEDVFGQKARILNHLHVLETCDASLPRENLRQGRRRQEVDGDVGGETNDGKRPRPRLILSLKKRVAAHSGEEEAKETKRVREKAGVHDPVDVASMISRVIANTAASKEGTTAPDTGGDISAARSAALSLALPLWLLLHDRPGMSKKRKTALHDVAEGMYETLRDHGVANNLDIAFLKIYECFSKRADSDETHECVAGGSP